MTTDNIFTQWTRIAFLRQPRINALAVVSFTHNEQSHVLLIIKPITDYIILKHAHHWLSISPRKSVIIDFLFKAVR